jgi:3-phosphoshikimate 1-carboxyvinyltransferase
MEHMPDAAMTMAVVNAFASYETDLRGLKTLRVKETDRIAALVTELAKVGVTVEPFAYTDKHGHPDEGIRINPPPGGIDCSLSASRVEFDTYDDHRMAMSLALIGLRRPNVYIRDPGCVRKTYPTFWRDLAKVYG